MTELENPPVLADDGQLFLSDMNDELSLEDGVVSRGHDADLDGGTRRRGQSAPVASNKRVLRNN